MAKHRRGSLTSARERAKSILDRMPFGTRVIVGQWIDTGEYEAKAGSGGDLHDRFRQVELWTSTPYKTKPGKKMVKLDIKAGRRNPKRPVHGQKIRHQWPIAKRIQWTYQGKPRYIRREGWVVVEGPDAQTGDYYVFTVTQNRDTKAYGPRVSHATKRLAVHAAELRANALRKGYESKKRKNPSDIDYTLKPTPISRVRVGDVILRGGKLKTVGSQNIKRGGMGITLFGDSYKLGKDPVMVAKIKHVKPKRKNPARGTRWRMDDGQIVTTDQLRRKFMGKLPTPAQRRMLGIHKVAPVKKSTSVQNLNSVKAIGDRSLRIEGSELTAYSRGGRRLARKYYASPESAQRAYKNITSVKKLTNWIERNSTGVIFRQNPRLLPDARTLPLWWVGMMDKGGAIPESKWKRVRAKSRQGAVKQFLQKAKGLGPRLDKGEVLLVHVSDGKRMHPTGVPMILTSYAIKRDD